MTLHSSTRTLLGRLGTLLRLLTLEAEGGNGLRRDDT